MSSPGPAHPPYQAGRASHGQPVGPPRGELAATRPMTAGSTAAEPTAAEPTAAERWRPEPIRAEPGAATAFGHPPGSHGPEATQPQPGLPFDPPPPTGPAGGRRKPSIRRSARPQTDIMVPSKITVTRVAAARTRQLTSNTVRRIHAASRADGAGESGLTGLIWTHALNVAGDALIAVSLAGTLFFAAAAGEQRGNVALYLVVTMAPFAIVAPVIGPALDRLQRGRRWALAATMLGRAILAGVMAANYDNFALYPAAFGALVLSKSYGVLKGAVVPRVLPGEMTLVTANARMSIFGLLTGGVAAGLGAGVAAVLGFGWELGFAVAVFVAAGVVTLKLPQHVDHSAGELPAAVLSTGQTGALTGGGRRSLGVQVVTALRGVAALRGLAGFLTIFTPFLVQGTIEGGFEGTLALGAIAGGAGLGSFVGTAIGARTRLNNPEVVVLSMVGAAALACLIGAIAFSIPVMAGAAFVAGVTNALGKHSLDAVIQREVPENLRPSAFARSETLLQICWVLGGGIAISLPLIGWIAFTVAAGLMAAAVVFALLSARQGRAAKAG